MSDGARRTLGVALGGAALLALVAAALWALGAGGPPSVVPTWTVAREDFVRTVAADGALVAVESTPVVVPQGAPTPARLAWLAPDGSAVKAGDVVLRFDPSDLEKQRLTAADELARSRLEIERKRAADEATLGNLGRDAEAARLEAEMAGEFASRDPEIYSRRQIIESEIDAGLAHLRLEHAERSAQTQGRMTRLEGELLALKRRRSELELDRTSAGLAALTVTAPFDGILMLERGWRGELPQVGDSLWPGQTIAEIPRLEKMAAEVYVLEADAGGLAAGKPAQVVVEAHSEHWFAATVERVGKIAQPRIQGSPVQYFTVTLALERTDPALMTPGQRVRAELELETATGVLSVPRQALFERAGRPVVYRSRDGAFEPVEVTLGPAAPGRVVIASGLAEGDVIALVDPERRGAEPPTVTAEPTEAPAGPAASGAARGPARRVVVRP